DRARRPRPAGGRALVLPSHRPAAAAAGPSHRGRPGRARPARPVAAWPLRRPRRPGDARRSRGARRRRPGSGERAVITLPTPGAAGGLRAPLTIGVVASVLLHLVVLAVRFAPPPPFVLAPRDSRLEVVLLNAGTVERPLAPDVVAQVNMAGGGDRDEGRATSPLVASPRVSDGDAIAQREQRVRELEELQRRLLARASEQAQVRDQTAQPEPRAKPGEDREQTEQLIARLQAQIERQISDYNK